MAAPACRSTTSGPMPWRASSAAANIPTRLPPTTRTGVSCSVMEHDLDTTRSGCAAGEARGIVHVPAAFVLRHLRVGAHEAGALHGAGRRAHRQLTRGGAAPRAHPPPA